jgi:hypothetical protein
MRITRRKKMIAVFFLIIFTAQLLLPNVSYALTSGPSQPEMAKFEPAGTSDMVDLFSGDMKYNIPLMDVGGYPVNLSYQSGTGMEDEASWVGAGWTLNPGAVNRTMRGLPDDFKGDEIKKTFYTKPFKKVGGSVNVKTTLFGWEKGKASVELGVYKDNYYGIGASVGAGVSFQLASNTKTPLNAGLNLLSDTRGGVDISANAGISTQTSILKEINGAGLSGGFKYNTREGLKSVSLGLSFNPTRENLFLGNSLDITYEKNFGQTYIPSYTVEKKNKGFTFSFDAGGLFTGFYGGVGGKGYTYLEEIVNNNTSANAYGYMHYLAGRSNTNALLDFNREKDGVFIKGTPAIAIPVSTHDYFNVTAQTGAQQFRPYFGGNYVVFDKRNSNTSDNSSFGATVGFGNLWQAGGNINLTNGGSRSAKWVANNNYLGPAQADFDLASLEEDIFFKQVGEKTLIDQEYFQKIGEEQTNRVLINQSGDPTQAKTYAAFKYRGSDPPVYFPPSLKIKREKREKRVSGFSYLDAMQASKYGLDKKINDENRVTNDRKGHHISEITVTDNEGKRMVYGIPVYNKIQKDITFAVQKKDANSYEQSRKTGLYTYTPGTDDKIANGNGRDNYYSKEEIPAYATSYLLTGILSQDYVDKTDNGISDDDPGTAVKFNYTKLADDYQWRAPYGTNTANYNEGFMSDHLDEKASISYGIKETWYLQSVESKTMIAIFELSNREDGLGVLGNAGGKNDQLKLKKLDKIKLYSKADWIKNGANATPIKVVNFEYDYSLYKEVLNNSNIPVDKNGTVLIQPSDINDPAKNVNFNKGKLTLKKVYFTFGKSTRGQSNPYEFEYDIAPINSQTSTAAYSLMDPLEKDDKYTERQSDRWGTYKQSFYNRTKTLAGGTIQPLLNNSEFPYVPQENRELSNRFASKWQLTKIITPSSGIITVTYESDDYAYVQNRKAMQMCFVKGIENIGQSNGLINADRLVIELPIAVNGTTDDDKRKDFREKYLSMGGGKYHESIFYKILTNLNNTPGKDEYVHGYADIDWRMTNFPTTTTASLLLKKIKPDKSDVSYNPIAIAGWQMLRSDLPQYAYDNYDNLEVGDGQAAIRSIVQALKNYIGELGRPFEKRAAQRKFADQINIEKSMIRLTNPDGFKIGGGARVKRIQISDEWNVLVPGGAAAVYGQEYDYTIKDKTGNVISSSGVASYEPQIGNEENPFHEPVSFTEKVFWGNDNYHFMEKPFCESYFPAASVGYSKVTVTSFGAQNARETGRIENEFYTAKEFPTIVDYLTLDAKPYENNLTVRLFSSTSIDKMVASQGFKIELNDMHGKPKNVKVFNKGGDLISSTEYYYNIEDDRAEIKKLKNTVDILLPDGTILPKQVGTDIDFVTDVRESISESQGDAFGLAVGITVIPFFFFPVPIPYAVPNYHRNSNISSFHSISGVKVVHKYGIVKKVVTTQNGSTIEAENLLWDGETGEVLLTRTQNEFDKSTYAFSYPAYMVDDYKGMGGAYHNLGALFSDFATGVNGDVSSYSTYLFPGDELIALNADKKGWVIKSGNTLRLVDKKGEFIDASGSWQILRSGRRNMLTASVGSVITMKDPRVSNQIVLDVDKRILDSKAIEFKDEWAVPVNNKVDGTITCTTFNPDDQESSLNYYTENPPSGTGTCDWEYFRASSVNSRRSFMTFSQANLPVGAVIQSVKLSLYAADNLPTPMLGQNEAFLKRVTGSLGSCNAPQWVDQPTVTNNGQVFLQRSTSTNQDYLDIDVTQMYNDWRSLNDASAFQLRINLVNESSQIPAQMFFYSYGGGPENTKRARLEICYSIPACVSPVNAVINPYQQGLLGNWRPVMNYAYTVAREQKPGNINQVGGTDIRNSGYYGAYSPFWNWQGGSLTRTFASNQTLALSDPRSRWIWSNKSIYYDQKGNEIESVDALNRYGAALFGYKQSVATAVGANARNNEIAFDGYEDYDFDLETVSSESCPLKRHFDFGFTKQGSVWTSPGGTISTEQSHTGKYSYKLNGTTTINKPAGNAAPPASSILSFDGSGKYLLNSNELANGFAPINGKKYLFSCWVYDGSPTTNTLNGVSISVNGISPTTVTVVEGWKRVEIPFIASANFNLVITGSGKFIDDLRIFPNDGQMNSYVYDDRTMRLVAQLDENNFATLYEYDDEGTPVRVKKETERGLMTLKENRQSLRKRN